MAFCFNYEPFIAIIGDIVQSREISDRKETQNKLKAILDNINRKYADEIASKFMITLGDEFQGLLRCGKNILDIIDEIETGMYPISLRFGIGIGEMDTDINFDMPLGSDGPAYHNARKMIDEIKIKENRYETDYSNIMIWAQGENEHTAMLLNGIISLCSALKSKWTSRQKEIISCYLESDKNQYTTAEKLGINQTSVHRALDLSKYYTYQNAIDIVKSTLREIKRNDDDV